MLRTLFAGTTALVLLVTAAQAYQGGEVILDKKDQLTDKDPAYKPDLSTLSDNLKKDPIAPKLLMFIEGNPHKVYTLKFKKGDKVVIELKSAKPGALDTVVIVEDAKKNILDLNDDNPDLGGKSLDSKLVWTAPADGDYRIIATVLHAVVMAKTGDFQLTVTKAK